MARPSALGAAGRYALVLLAAVVVGVPLLFTFLSSFKESGEIFLGAFLPRRPTLENYRAVLSDPVIFRSFLNSLLITAVAVAGGAVFSLMASLPVVRRREAVFRVGYVVFLSSMIIPSISGLIPLYVLMARLRLLDKPFVLGVIHAIAALPFGVLVFSSFLKTVPVALEESAMLDGCGYVRRVLVVVAPLMRAPILTFVALQMPGIWNDFMMPLLFLRGKYRKTLTLLVYSFTRDHESDYGAIFALIVIGMILPVVFYVFARKAIDQSIGATVGGVKG